MAKILDGDFIVPDMRKKRNYHELAAELITLNESKLMASYDMIKRIAINFDSSPIEFLANELERTEKLNVKGPKMTQKEIVEKTLNTTLFTSTEDRYKRNMKQMLKTSGLNDQLRKLRGWQKGNPKAEEFEYDDSIGRLIFNGEWVIDHDEDYFASDGIRIVHIAEYTASAW